LIYLYYSLMVVIAFLVAIAQINFKIGASRINVRLSFHYNIKNWHLILGLFLFSLAPFLSVFVMRVVDFSVFYAFTALNYFFVMILSKILLHEKIDRFKIIGNIVIILGIIVFNL